MLPSFTSLVGITGSHIEDEPVLDAFLASSEEKSNLHVYVSTQPSLV